MEMIAGSYCSVDGKVFQIFVLRPFSAMWYSHKFSGPGIRYETTLSHKSGNIVEVNGPFSCGKFPDIKLINSKFCVLLETGENGVADSGYTFERCTTLDDVRDADKKTHTRLRARHE